MLIIKNLSDLQKISDANTRYWYERQSYVTKVVNSWKTSVFSVHELIARKSCRI